MKTPLELDTPAGPLALGRRGGRLSAEWIAGGSGRPDPVRDPATDALGASIERYFAGDPSAFDDLPTGEGTPFQRRVWETCRTIPFGETRTYGWIAEMLGMRAGGARAVGQALRRNPLPLVVPCHRVVGAEGRGGYAGATAGPMAEVKARLLAFERTCSTGNDTR